MNDDLARAERAVAAAEQVVQVLTKIRDTLQEAAALVDGALYFAGRVEAVARSAQVTAVVEAAARAAKEGSMGLREGEEG